MFLEDALDVENVVFNHITQQGFLFRRLDEIAHFLLFLLFLIHSDNVTVDTIDVANKNATIQNIRSQYSIYRGRRGRENFTRRKSNEIKFIEQLQ